MNRDLFLAILAMDSYNRGYGRRLKVGENGPDGPGDNLEIGILSPEFPEFER